MRERGEVAFLLLIGAQALHTTEEYATALYDRLPPATFISEQFSAHRPTGFLVFNGLFIGAMLQSWVIFRRGRPVALALVWFWLLLESANAIGHFGLALAQRGYFPGVVTAPLLLVAAANLAVRLKRT